MNTLKTHLSKSRTYGAPTRGVSGHDPRCLESKNPVVRRYARYKVKVDGKPSKRIEVSILVPNLILDYICSQPYTDIEQSNLLYIVNRILFSYIKFKEENFEDFIPMSADYWRLVMPTNYSKYLYRLQKLGIVIINNNYSNYKGSECCKGFKFSDPYLSSISNLVPCSVTIVDKRNNINRNRQQEKGSKFKRDNYVKDTTLNLLRLISIDIEQARKIIRKRLERVRQESTIVDINSEDRAIKLETTNGMRGSRDKGYWKQSEAIETFGPENIVEYHEKFFPAESLDIFNSDRERLIELSYNYFTLSFSNNIHYCARRKEKERLYTTLTNLPSLLIPALIINGEHFASIDLKNSQMTILSRLIEMNYFEKYIPIEDYPDLSKFIEMSRSGNLYDYIKEQLEFNTRDDAKLFIMKLIFSKPRYNSSEKRKLRGTFPGLVALCDGFKTKKGHNQLAILLQKKESEIFIDKILYKLLKKGYHAFSKHDSILCPISELEAVKKIMEEILNKALGEVQLKVEHHI